MSDDLPHYHGHRDRLRERFATSGSGDAFADYELLELLLFRVIPRADTKPIAKALLARFGSLSEVLGAPAARLQEVSGVKAAVALDLKVVAAAAKRMARGEIKGREVLSDGWTAVTRDRSLSAQYEHTVGVTATGCEIFTLSPKGLDRPGLPS